MKLKTILTAFALLLCANVTESQDLWQLHKYDETNSSLEGHTTQILQDNGGLLWIATWNGIYRFDGYEFRRIKPGVDDSCSMTSDRIRDIWLAKDGNMYVRNDEKLYHFDITTYHFRNLRDDAEQQEAERQRDNQPSRGHFVNERLEYIDPQGLEWLFDNDALYCMSRVESPAKPLPMEKPAMVRCLKMDSHKRVWVSTKEDATLRLFTDSGELLGYMGPDGTLSPSYRSFGHAVYCVTETSDGKIWLGTKPDGLFRLTASDNGGKPRFFIESIGGLESASVYSIVEDKQQRLWIATLGGGVACVEKHTDKEPHVINRLPGYPTDVCQKVRHLLINQKDVLLAATTEGLVVAKIENDLKSMAFRVHTKDANGPTSLSCNATMDIVETVEGRIFVATETGGISEIKSRDLLDDKLTFKHYDMAAGLLPSDMIIGMTIMPNGHLLVTSNTKLIKLDINNDKFESLCHHFFHNVYHFSEARPLLLSDGRWLLGCLDGAFTLPSSAAHHSSYQPPLLLTSISFANEKTLLAVTHLDTLRLKPEERNLTIHFAALDYVDPQALCYQYRMGTDTTATWNNLGTAHSITLLDLTPDTYQLTLRSTNADGVWTDNMRTLTIIVEPLLWETTWARVLMALLILAIPAIVVYTLLYIKGLKRKQHETLQKYLALLEEDNRQRDNDLLPGTTIPSAFDNSPDQPIEDPVIQRMLTFVEQNIDNGDADIAAMADACAVSRSVLQRKMKQLMGISPAEFMREARIKHACQLLRNSDATVSEVAYQCGFNDPKYFSRCFRQALGMSPKEYKST